MNENTNMRALFLVIGFVAGVFALGVFAGRTSAPPPPDPMATVIESRRTVGQASKELDRCLAVNHACLRLLMAVEVQASATDGGQ